MTKGGNLSAASNVPYSRCVVVASCDNVGAKVIKARVEDARVREQLAIKTVERTMKLVATAALLAGFGFSGINGGPNQPGRCDPNTPTTGTNGVSGSTAPNDSPGCGWSWGSSPLENLIGSMPRVRSKSFQWSPELVAVLG